MLNSPFLVAGIDCKRSSSEMSAASITRGTSASDSCDAQAWRAVMYWTLPARSKLSRMFARRGPLGVSKLTPRESTFIFLPGVTVSAAVSTVSCVIAPVRVLMKRRGSFTGSLTAFHLVDFWLMRKAPVGSIAMLYPALHAASCVGNPFSPLCPISASFSAASSSFVPRNTYGRLYA